MKREDYSFNSVKKENLLYAIDIGCTKLRLISGLVDENKFVYIHGLVEIPCFGVKQGSISDFRIFLNQIACLIQSYQDTYQEPVNDVVIGVSGRYVFFDNTQSLIKVPLGIIQDKEKKQAIEYAVNSVQSKNKKDCFVMHVIPQQYQTDSFSTVFNPVGMYAKQLKAKVHVICCDAMYKRIIEKTIKDISPDMNISSFVYDGNAASSAVLSKEEKDLGVIHLDIGGDSVDITVFDNNQQVMSFGLNFGGNYITEQISKAFSISHNLADFFKCNYGVADPNLLTEGGRDQNISYCADRLQFMQPTSEQVNIKLESLTNVINHSVISMISNIILNIEQFALHNKSNLEVNSGIVITGGSSKLIGIDSVLNKWLSDYSNNQNSVITCSPRVRIGLPIGFRNTDYFLPKDFVNSPDKAVAIGLLRESYGLANKHDVNNIGKSKSEKSNILEKIKNFFF